MNFELKFEDMDILEIFDSVSEEFDKYKISNQEFKENSAFKIFPTARRTDLLDQQAELSANVQLNLKK